MWDCLYVTQGPLCVPYFLIVVLVAGLVILNLFLALLLSSFSDMGGDKKEDEGPDKIQVAIMRIKNFKSWLVKKIKGLCSKRRVSAVGANPVLMVSVCLKLINNVILLIILFDKLSKFYI